MSSRSFVSFVRATAANASVAIAAGSAAATAEPAAAAAGSAAAIAAGSAAAAMYIVCMKRSDCSTTYLSRRGRYGYCNWCMYAVLVVFLWLIAPQTVTTARAQSAGAELSVDSARIGERFELTITVPNQSSRRAEYPSPLSEDSLLGDLLVLEPPETTRSDAGHMRARYTVTTFALDSAYVPPLPVQLISSRDTLLLLTPALILPVGSVVPDTATAVRDLAPLFTFGRPLWPWILLGAAILCLAGLLAYYLRHRRTDEPSGVPAAPRASPLDEAIEGLQELETTYDPDRHVKPYYVTLSNILRTYLHRRLHIPALESTTFEVAGALHRLPNLPDQTAGRVQDVLSLADLAKFADVVPPAEKGRIALDDTREIIQGIEARRRPKPTPATEGET